MMVRGRTITVSVLAISLVGIALPVHGYFQVHSFYNISEKYRQWYHETVWLQDTRANEGARGLPKSVIATSTADKYPYPEKAFVMTEKVWQVSSGTVEFGDPDWYDVEVVRQRAEMEGYPPAMDILGWMYENGQGLKRDYRKAFMWYERAALAGKTNLRGSSAKIFHRLNQRDRYFAQLQSADDQKRIEKGGGFGYAGSERVKLHVLGQQRDPKFYANKRKKTKKKK